jgi:hypothetical protein
MSESIFRRQPRARWGVKKYMLRSMTICALGLAAASVIAQGPADLPAGHWAAQSVNDLYRLGILKGYPDQLYRGSRPATRYELAQALAGLYSSNMADIDSLKAQIAALKPQSSDVEGIAAIRRRLDALDGDVRVVQGYRPQIDELQTTFEGLLKQVRAMDREVRDARMKTKG